MHFLISIVSLVLLAKIFGELAERLNLPSVLGELLAGVVLGPTLLGFVTVESLTDFATLGIILLLFLIGFEFDFDKARGNLKASVLVPVCGFVFVLVPTYFIFRQVGLGLAAAIISTVVMGGESTPNAIKVLIDMKAIKSVVASHIISVAVIEDVIFYTILAFTAGLIGAESIGGSVASLGKIAIFFAIFYLMEKASPAVIRYSEKMKTEEAQFAMAFILMLLLAFAAEYLGFASITGAFFAGIALSYSPYLHTGSFTPKMTSFTYGVFSPLFFAWMGLQLTPATITLSPIVVGLVCVGIGGKLMGNFVGGLLGGISPKESLGVALGLMVKGGEQLLVLIIAQQLGVFMVGGTDYLTLMMMPVMVLTMLITIFGSPIPMRLFFRWYEGTPKAR